MSSTLYFKELALRNFLSFGNQETVIDLSAPGTISIEGQNLDQGGSNGAGKTTLINAICYALYNKPFDNISLQRLINSTNSMKNTLMEVRLAFDRAGDEYEITRVRGEQYTICITRNGDDITPGKGVTECDALIESIIGISYELFTKTVIFSGNASPFLLLPIAQQRGQIEELFNITLLSEKAAALRENIKTTEGDIKVQEAIVKQQEVAAELYSKHKRESNELVAAWDDEHRVKLNTTQNHLQQYQHLDFDKEADNLRKLDLVKGELAVCVSRLGRLKQIDERVERWNKEHSTNLSNTKKRLEELRKIDFITQQASHLRYAEVQHALKTLQAELAPLSKDHLQHGERVEQLLQEQEHLKDDTCPYCSQHFAGSIAKLELVSVELEERGTLLLDIDQQVNTLQSQKQALQAELVKVKEGLLHRTLEELLGERGVFLELERKLKELNAAVNPHLETRAAEGDKTELEKQQAELQKEYDALRGLVMFDTLEAMLHEKQELAELRVTWQILQGEINPHLQSLYSLEKEGMPKIDREKVDALKKRLEHQQFLLKLLINKDSFLRRRIINKTIPFLNDRINTYTAQLGLPHIVRFDADLSCTVSEFGRELDFGNLSAGEKKRVNIGMALAFRDVLHHLHAKSNLLLIDELDGQLDGAGIDAIVRVLKEKSRDDELTVYVISHHPNVAGRLDRTMTICKEHGFSTIAEVREG